MSKEITKKDTQELTMSQRFANMVIAELASSFGGMTQVTEEQKELIQGYFIKTDEAIRNAKPRGNYPKVTWNNIDLPRYAEDLKYFAQLGVDMRSKNTLFPIPFYNKDKGIYTMSLMPGYNGIRYVAKKFAIDPPISETIEIVYSTDRFEPMKKSFDNPVENYVFEITDPFNRGEIKGGFVYLGFENPANNKLIIMSRAEIMKRKPYHGNVEFWGSENKEAWQKEMVYKTLIREGFSERYLPIDTTKVTDGYYQVMETNMEFTEAESASISEENANQTLIDVEVDEVEENEVQGQPIELQEGEQGTLG